MRDWIDYSEAVAHVQSIEGEADGSAKLHKALFRGEILSRADKLKRHNWPTTTLIPPTDRAEIPPSFWWRVEPSTEGDKNDVQTPKEYVDEYGYITTVTWQNEAIGIHLQTADVFKIWPRDAEKAPVPHRPAGTGQDRADAPHVAKMRTIVQQQSVSATAAAWQIVGKDGSGVAGNASPDSKVKRLVRRYKGEENGE